MVTVKTLASGDATPGEGETVTFEITVTNDGPAQATNVSLTDLLPTGITYTTNTTTQGTYDPVTGLFDIGTLASGATATLTLSGTVDFGQGGNTITNITTAATGDQTDPSTAGDDLVESVDVLLINAEIGVAKQAVGTPTLLSNGNFAVTYEVVVENIGSVGLTNLTVEEDLATQFGAAYVNAFGLTLVTPPTDAYSVISLDSAAWNGGSNTEILDTGITPKLAIGDSFVFQFTAEIDAVAATGVLDNTVTAGGDAVDANGNPLTDANGNPITATDDSDSGADPSSTNAGQPGDMGTSDDPTPTYLPDIGLAKSASGAVVNGNNFDVTFTLVWENTGNVALDNVDLIDDIAAQFGGQFVGIVPGSLVIQNFAGNGTVPTANAAWEADTTQSLITSNGPLEVGDTFEVVFTATIDPAATGPAGGLENQATSSGLALDENGVPLADASGAPTIVEDKSDNGLDPTSENGEDNGDGIFGNDPTPVLFADISVAKSVAGTPTALSNGNFEVVYELVIANTGTVELANLTLVEDLNTQFGPALISAGNVTLTGTPRTLQAVLFWIAAGMEAERSRLSTKPL